MDSESSDHKKETKEDRDFKANANIGRLALSKNTCRFELPMDMRKLEGMTPSHYIEYHCRINERRKASYRKVFDKFKLKAEKEEWIDLKLFEDCLIEVHMKSISKSQVNIVSKLACLKPDQKISAQLFFGLAALSERVLYDQFVTEDTADLPDYQKDKIESADFGSLNSKIFGINVSEDLLNLMRSL